MAKGIPAAKRRGAVQGGDGRLGTVTITEPGMIRTVCLLLALSPGAATTAVAADPAPEIVRATSPAQPLGATHVARAIPEACVFLQGRFGAEAARYALAAVPKQRCAARATFLGVDGQDEEPGWILNDRIRIPRSDRADCVATIEVWRHPGKLADAKRDAQQRVRMYLDTDTAPVQQPRFRATLAVSDSCRS
jgi:hypothetical protein